MKLRKHLLLLLPLLLFRLTPAPGQDSNPLDKVQFYDIDDISVSEMISDAGQPEWYNKTYDPYYFRGHYFMPWKLNPDEYAFDLRKSADFQKFFDAAERLKKSECHAGNYQPFGKQFSEALLDNIDLATYPNRQVAAMVVAVTDLRRLPTEEFCFQEVRNAGEGYPFDYFQETSLWIGTPLLILHEAKDKNWYFAVSPYNRGWVAAGDVALVSRSQQKRLMKGELQTVLDDGAIAVSDALRKPLSIGTLLPTARDGVYLPVKAKNGQLRLKPAALQSGAAAKFPLPFTSANIQRQLDQLLGVKYSWGGLDGGRDCSSTIKDLLTPFGIWLPRDSKDQYQVGEVTEVTGNREEKLSAIRERGLPFLTIIYKRGHSMLYIGRDHNDVPLIFHNVWGLKPILQDNDLARLADRRSGTGVFGIHRRSADTNEVSARYIIGRSVITAVDPERGFREVRFDAFIDNIVSMNIFVK